MIERDRPGELITPGDTAIRGRPRFVLGPESLGAGLAAILLIATVALLVRNPGTAPTANGVSPSPSAGSAGASAGASAKPTVNLADIEACLAIDARLAADRAALQAEADAKPFEATNVALILRGANADVVSAMAFAERLRRDALTADIGALLLATYSDLHREISDTLDNSIQNVAAYRTAAVEIAASLARLDALDTVLRSIRDSARRSPPPEASLPPVSAPPASPPASVGPATAPPGSPVPGSPTPSGFVNPGFEAGVGAPWELVLSPGAAATLVADPSDHVGGVQSARVDITIAGSERAAVAVRQGGLSVQAGAHYVATIMVRAAESREVRIRIASASGDTYGTRLYTVGTTWQALTVDSTILATDPNAYLEIDLGRFGATTWLDDATFVQVAASPG